MNQEEKPFELPPSPFQAEKERLGEGFLGDGRSRSKPWAGRSPIAHLGIGRRRRKHLSDEEREIIGASTGPRTPVANRFGVSVEWVTELRRRYRDQTD